MSDIVDSGMSDKSPLSNIELSDSGNSAIPHAAEQANKPNAMRDRIADAIRRAGYEHSYAPGPYLAGVYADAVIEALRLRPVEGTVSRFESKTYRRYITDWTPDD